MSESDDAAAMQVQAWLVPLPDADAPCGPDLEYDNEFLALHQACAGKPETQFSEAEPPDWRNAVGLAASLFERTRDLRVAVQWLRGTLALQGYAALPSGLGLVCGLLETFWDGVHPLPEDGDAYGRVNALTLLRDPAGLLGELRDARLAEDRAIGVLKVRDVEAAFGNAPGAAYTKDQVQQMMAAAQARSPDLRAQCRAAQAQIERLIALVDARFARAEAPDLAPLATLAGLVAAALPAEAEAAADAPAAFEATDEAGAPSGGSRAGARGLSGAVASRADALRAIDMVIAYLEQAEPTNPAPLFLRRARQLIGHNFLQLMKALAPDALSEVARIVGIDPETVEEPPAD
ncbi:MAG: type VI secretion system protein TssA [Burkholderiales bacterium]|nr:type VI secretion system protein TssA [Burkholderiales bacterium]